MVPGRRRLAVGRWRDDRHDDIACDDVFRLQRTRETQDVRKSVYRRIKKSRSTRWARRSSLLLALSRGLVLSRRLSGSWPSRLQRQNLSSQYLYIRVWRCSLTLTLAKGRHHYTLFRLLLRFFPLLHIFFRLLHRFFRLLHRFFGRLQGQVFSLGSGAG